MKKIVAALAVALALPALAQDYPPPVAPTPGPIHESDINPGALQLTASTGLDWSYKSVTASGDTTTAKDFRGGLSAMYFISRFLAFGLDFEYTHHEPEGGGYESDFYFGPKAGIDWELVRHLSLFADLTVGIGRGETKEPDLDPVPGQGFGWGVTGGMRLFANRNVSLDLFGSFRQLLLAFDSGPDKSISDLTAGIALSVYLTNNPANSVYR